MCVQILCQVKIPLLWIWKKPNPQGYLRDTNLKLMYVKVAGSRWNCLDEPVFIAGPKHLLTEFCILCGFESFTRVNKTISSLLIATVINPFDFQSKSFSFNLPDFTLGHQEQSLWQSIHFIRPPLHPGPEENEETQQHGAPHDHTRKWRRGPMDPHQT